MTSQLKDLFQEFAPAATAEVAQPAADMPEERRDPADSATVAAVTDFTAAIEALTAVLDEESGVIGAGAVDELEAFAQRKLAMIERLETIGQRVSMLKPTLDAEMRATIGDAIERLNRAVHVNTSSLVAMREAVLTINRAILQSAERAASDGVYSPGGAPLRPVELSTAGIDASL